MYFIHFRALLKFTIVNFYQSNLNFVGTLDDFVFHVQVIFVDRSTFLEEKAPAVFYKDAVQE